MHKIYGKHSILHAVHNSFRELKRYYGNKNFYENNRFADYNCGFVPSREEYLEVRELFIECDFSTMYELNKIILLDSLEDPRNIGSIIRSAAILGFGVLIRRSKGCEINETVLKCASGGVDIAPIMYINNVNESLERFKNKDFWIGSLDESGIILNNNENIFANIKKILIVVGSEGFGVSKIVKESSDFIFSLQSNSNVFSTYNASVASSIMMYELNKIFKN